MQCAHQKATFALMVSALALGCAGDGGGGGGGDVPERSDYGSADPSATRPGPVATGGAPETTSGSYAPYAPGDRVDLGGADAVFVGPDYTQAGHFVTMPGDMDGDGFSEMVVANTSWREDSIDRIRHALHIVYGASDLDPERFLGEADTTLLTPYLSFHGGDAPVLASVGDLDGDARADLLVGVPGSNPGDAIAGRVFVIYGQAERRLGEHMLEDVAVELTDGVRGGIFGLWIAGIGDTNADGRKDFAIASADADGRWSLLLYYGSRTRLTHHAAPDAILEPPPGSRIGRIAGIGDVDDDQFEDFVVEGSAADTHRAWLVRGTGSRRSGVLRLEDVGVSLDVRDPINALGGLGDLDGDGVPEFAIGSMGEVAAHVFFGDRTRFRDSVTDADAVAQLTTDEPHLTTTITGAGDVNGDGFVDFLIGIPTAGEQRGAVHLVLGDGTRRTGPLDLDTESVTFLGRELTHDPPFDHLVVHDRSGSTIGAGHDVNGDGLDDFIVGAPGDALGDSTGGRAYVVFGIAASPEE